MFTRWPVTVTSDAESSDSTFWWLIRLRWLAGLGVALVLLVAGPVLDELPEGSAPWLWGVAGLLVVYNIALAVLGQRGRWPWFSHPGFQIVVDCLALTAFMHFAGGIENPFLPLFLLQIVAANIVLQRRAAELVLGLVVTLVALVVLGEGLGLLAHHCLLPTGERCFGATVDSRSLAVLGGLVLTFVATALFTRSLTAKLRAGQRSLLSAIDELNGEKEQLADARAAIENERSRLQAIVDCMSDAVTFLGPDGRVLFSNQRAREIWQASGLEPGPEIYSALFQVIQKAPHSLAPSTFDRAGHTFEATHSLVHSKQGETLGLVMVARDISERLALERHFLHEEQMSVVGKLAAAVAHEINNPIGVIFLYAQHALAKSSPDSPIYGHLETIRRNADGCRKIVGELLNLARPRKPERRRVDLRRLCREILDSIRPFATRTHVRLSGGGHAEDVPIWAEADAGLLSQAVLNLALNAIEASGDGGEVSISAYETQDANATARVIVVRDSGPGVDNDLHARIFLPFFTTKPGGTGLGLAVAQNIVKSHAGRIELETTVDVGTTFRIVLPVLTAPRRSGRDTSAVVEDEP